MKNTYKNTFIVLAIVLLSAFFHSVFAGEPTQFEKVLKELRSPSGKTVLVVAHRGDWRNFHENTLEGILGAVEMGADVVEIDVQKTKDGHFVLIHDKTVDRTTNGKGNVADLTLEEIQSLKLRVATGGFTPYRIPTLQNVLIACKGRVVLNLDKLIEPLKKFDG